MVLNIFLDRATDGLRLYKIVLIFCRKQRKTNKMVLICFDIFFCQIKCKPIVSQMFCTSTMVLKFPGNLKVALHNGFKHTYLPQYGFKLFFLKIHFKTIFVRSFQPFCSGGGGSLYVLAPPTHPSKLQGGYVCYVYYAHSCEPQQKLPQY